MSGKSFWALRRKRTGTFEPTLYKSEAAAKAKADQMGMFDVVPLFTAAPVREEGGAVRAWMFRESPSERWHVTMDRQHVDEYLKAFSTAEVHPLAIATREKAPACKKCGGKGYTEHEGGEGEGYPSRPEIEACSCREEAPAEAGEREAIAAIITGFPASYYDNETCNAALMGDWKEALRLANQIIALRAQPPARSGESQ